MYSAPTVLAALTPPAFAAGPMRWPVPPARTRPSRAHAWTRRRQYTEFTSLLVHSFFGSQAKNLSLAIGRPANLAKNLSLGSGPVRS